MHSIFAIMCCVSIGTHQQCALGPAHKDETSCVAYKDRIETADGETCRCVEYYSEQQTCKPQGLLLPFGTTPLNTSGFNNSVSPH